MEVQIEVMLAQAAAGAKSIVAGEEAGMRSRRTSHCFAQLLRWLRTWLPELIPGEVHPQLQLVQSNQVACVAQISTQIPTRIWTEMRQPTAAEQTCMGRRRVVWQDSAQKVREEEREGAKASRPGATLRSTHR